MKIRITRHREFTVEQPPETINAVLQGGISGVRIKCLHNGYKAYPDVSVGVGMSLANNISLPISTEIRIHISEPNSTKVTLFTRPRIELILIALLWLVLAVLQLFGNKEIPLAVTVAILPIALLWFWAVYRIQEAGLQTRIEKALKS